MTSPVDVVNMALQQVGSVQSTISSFDEDSTEAQVARLLYEPKLKDLMRAAQWGFARRQKFLTQLRAAVIDGEVSDDPPPQPWLREYAYPPDCLRIRYLMPNLSPTSGESSVPLTTGQQLAPYTWNATNAIRFTIANSENEQGDQIKSILTDVPEAQAVYTIWVSNPNLWDVEFLNAATNYLGVWFINSLARDRGSFQDQINLTMQIVRNARAADGNEGVTTMDHLPDWIAIRGLSGGVYNGPWNVQWDPLAWPGGFLS